MTIDDLAVATQQEFQLVREEMREMKTEIITEITQVLVAVIEKLDRRLDGLEMHLSAYASRANDDITALQELT